MKISIQLSYRNRKFFKLTEFSFNKMGKIISLMDRLREESKKVKYEQNRFPIFEGRVLAVSGEMIYGGETTSIVDYLPSGAELPEPNVAMAFMGKGKEDYEKIFREIVQRALVPFSVNPEIVNGANVRGYTEEIKDGYSEYVLEVLRDETMSDMARTLSSIAGHNIDSKYGGFRYIVLFND